MAASAQTAYEHDELNRLTVVTEGSGGAIRYVYDAAGNLRRKMVGSPGGPRTLGDTGVPSNACYAAGSNALRACDSPEAKALDPQQDGMVGLDVSNNNAADGWLGFSYEAVAGGACVRDKITGLVWENKTVDGGIHDMQKTFTNLGSGAGGDAGALVAQSNAAGWCGYTDWRLPSKEELRSLVNYGQTAAGAQIDVNWFPNTAVSLTWTATPVAGGAGAIWAVHFATGGYDDIRQPTNAHAVRMVRGAMSHITDGRYVVSADGSEVTDRETGLVWSRGYQLAANQEAAFAVAAVQRAQTGQSWRVPSIKELESLVYLSRASPAIDTDAFPNTESQYFWTSTPTIPTPSQAWCIGFVYGGEAPADRMAQRPDFRVRLVRDGP